MVTLRSSNARHANQRKSIPSVASSRSSSPPQAWPHCEEDAKLCIFVCAVSLWGGLPSPAEVLTFSRKCAVSLEGGLPSQINNLHQKQTVKRMRRQQLFASPIQHESATKRPFPERARLRLQTLGPNCHVHFVNVFVRALGAEYIASYAACLREVNTCTLICVVTCEREAAPHHLPIC